MTFDVVRNARFLEDLEKDLNDFYREKPKDTEELHKPSNRFCFLAIHALTLVRYDDMKCIGASIIRVLNELYPDTKSQIDKLNVMIDAILVEERPGMNDAQWVRWKMLREREAVLRVMKNCGMPGPIGQSAKWSLDSMRKKDPEVDKIVRENS